MKGKKAKVGDIVRKKNGTLDVRTPLMPTKKIESKKKRKPKYKDDLLKEQ